jgi:hypothetical protein
MGACAWNLMLAALCFQQLLGRDAAEVAQNCQWDAGAAEAARAVVQDGLVKALLKGDLLKLLSQFTPTGLAAVAADPLEAGRGGMYASESTNAALARHLANKMEATGSSMPAAHCEVATESVDQVVRRLCVDEPSFAKDMVGLEKVPDLVASMRPKDIAVGRLSLSFDWHGVREVDAQTFEVPLTTIGRCPWHPHLVFYSPTTAEDIFAVVIPWAGEQLPKEEAAFTACTEILRSIQPLDPLPFSAIHLTGFSAAAPMRMIEITDGRTLGFSGSGGSYHVSEFGTFMISAGRRMPGRLPPPPTVSNAALPMVVQRPYIFGFWHTAMDALNVPLAATLVV